MAAPVLAGPVLYTFNVTAGSVQLNIEGQGSTGGGLAGTFGVLIYQSDCHIGASDTYLLDHAYLVNTSTMKLSLAGLATATLNLQSARFLDFAMAAPGHIPPGGVGIAPTDVYVEASVLVTGLTTTTFSTKTWAGTLLPFNFAITTSATRSEIAAAAISGTFGYEIGISDIGLTITLDLIVNVEGTAHVVPDPALGGLTAMGLAGAGAWLRRRS
jgi:hypothetical protein